MNLIGISVNHKTSPLEIREALHLNSEEIIEFINILKEKFLYEGIIISTCNRTEIIGLPSNIGVDSSPLINKLVEFKKVDGLNSEHYSRYFSCGAVKHLFSVSSGIDSLIIGDSQILGQVKDAFDISDDLNFAGTVLRRILDTAIKVGKRSIKETTIGEGAVTISYASVQVVEKIFANLSAKSALVIGAGETGELAAVHLRDKGIGKIAIANRTIARAEELAKKINGEILPFESLENQLHNFDIIISATSAEGYVVPFSYVKDAIKKRKGSPIVMMDIAVPRDIDPKVKDLDNVFYHDMDSLKVIVEQNMQKRRDQIPIVNEIIMEEMIGFFGWYNTLDVVPTIKSIRNFFEEMRADELEKIRNKINTEDFLKVEDMTRRLIGRILHNPTVKLREYAETGANIKEVLTNTGIIKDLFNLGEFESSRNKKNSNELKDED